MTEKDNRQTTVVAPRDQANWAKQTDAAHVSAVPSGARNLNVEGKQASGPLQGFGPMWQKTYRVRLVGSGATPREVIAAWKENFAKFWPPKNKFYAPLTGIAPGEAALINSSLPGGMPLSTGVMVLYADDESFTLMTTQGHPFPGVHRGAGAGAHAGKRSALCHRYAIWRPSGRGQDLAVDAAIAGSALWS